VNGYVKSVRCEGYIAFGLSGFWDEVIIDRAQLLSEHPSIDRALSSITQRLGTDWSDSGNEQRNTRRWMALVIHLSDGCLIEIVAANFTIA